MVVCGCPINKEFLRGTQGIGQAVNDMGMLFPRQFTFAYILAHL